MDLVNIIITGKELFFTLSEGLEIPVSRYPVPFSILFLFTLTAGLRGLFWGGARLASILGGAILLFFSTALFFALLHEKEGLIRFFTQIKESIPL